MPSVKNPNTPNKARRVASRAKVQKKRAQTKTTKNPRGTANSSVLYPTSGPAAPLSGKKARKVEKARAYARKRELEKMVANGMIGEDEVEMTDAPKSKKAKTSESRVEEQMDIDGIA